MSQKPTYEDLGHKVKALSEDLEFYKKKAKALEEAKDYYKALLEHCGDGVVAFDPESTRPIDFNNQACQQLGYSREEFAGLCLRDIDAAETDEQTRVHISKVMENGFDSFDTLQRTKQGEIRNVHVSTMMLDVCGRQIYQCIFRDITDSKLAEEAIQESEQRFRAAFMASPMAMVISTLDESIWTDANQAALDMFGFTADEVVGKIVKNKNFWLDPTDRQRIVADLTQGKEVRNRIIQLRHSDGHLITVSTSASALTLKGKKHIFYVTEDITDRKRAETALVESEEKFRNFADRSFVGINLIQDGLFKYVNPKFAEIFGYSVEHCLENMSFDQLVYPEDLPTVQESIHKRLSGETKTVHYEFRGVRKNSDIVHLEIFGTSTFFNGKPAVIGTILDITDRKRAEEALRQSESTLNLVLETVPLPVFYKDRDGRYLKINHAFEAFYGKSREEVIGKNTFDVSHPELAQLYHSQDVKMFEKGGIQIYDSQIQDANGALHDVISYKAPLVDEKGSVFGLVGAILDITDRKRAENELRKYEHIVSSTQDMIVLLDRHFVYLAVNEAYLKAMGKTAPEMIGKTAADVVGEDFFQNIIRPRAERSLTGETTNYQNWYDYPAAGRRYVDAVYSPYLGKGGEVLGFVVTLRDITEYQNLQAQLSQAQKMESVGRLAGGVAHEYNNMLSIIMGYGELARGKVAPSHPLNADLMEILSAAKRSADITRQLLAFSRKQTVSPKVLDINDSIKSMFKMLRRLIGEDIELALLPETNVWQVKTDPSQVDQILVNLCVNSRDALIGAGKITIETQNAVLDKHYCANNAGAVPGEYVMFAVSDNGSGIAPENLNKIFEPFFTTKGVGKGTGLGLATVYGIVKQNNGFVKACSQPGRGTTIKVYLPRHISQSVEETRNNHLEIPSGRGETILLVEDEVSILKFSQMLLKRLGYHELSTASPTEAIQLATAYTGKIDLLLTDVVMPVMDGRELSNRLQQIYPDLKVLFMSGYTADVIADRGVLKEGLCFINKPFSIRDLAIKIREVLDTAKPEL